MSSHCTGLVSLVVVVRTLLGRERQAANRALERLCWLHGGRCSQSSISDESMVQSFAVEEWRNAMVNGGGHRERAMNARQDFVLASSRVVVPWTKFLDLCTTATSLQKH